MSDVRRVYDLDANAYEHPNRTWQCGRAEEGVLCPLGPTANGRCGAVCKPLKEGDRYYCGNASPLGGKCDQGPLADGTCCQHPAQCEPSKKEGNWVCMRGLCHSGPTPDGQCCRQSDVCQPVRSVMSKRRILTLSVFALAVGLALVLVSGPLRKKVVSPGPLTSQHSVIEHGCADCHIGGDENMTKWTELSFAKKTDIHQSKLCLKCHSNLGDHAMYPHSHSPAALAAITASTKSSESPTSTSTSISAAQWLLGKPRPVNDEFACATCHQEHRGDKFDLTQISNQQCQSCHTKVFHRFHNDHHNFINYPHSRRTRIYFDHDTHYGRHFSVFKRIMPEGKKPESCRTCHVLDDGGNTMVLQGFEQTCASCHDRQIESDLLPNLVAFALSAVDLKSLEKAKVMVGEWPLDQKSKDSLGPSGELPPLMQLLLSSDEEFIKSRPVVEELDLRYLENADEQQLQAVGNYLWTIKALLYDLTADNPQPLRARLTAALGPDVEKAQIEDLALSLSRDVFKSAQSKWLPNLNTELEAKRSGKSPPQDSSPADKEVEEADANTGNHTIPAGWFPHTSDHSVSYRAAHHADVTMQKFLEIIGKLDNRSKNEKEKENQSQALIRNAAVDNFIQQLTDPATTGRCTKCHTTDRLEERLVINWHAARPAPHTPAFTKFSHEPHLLAGNDENCEQCHARKKEGQRYPKHFMSDDWTPAVNPHNFSSDFANMSPMQCAKCHKPNGARDNCLTCHNYHVHTTKAPLPSK